MIKRLGRGDFISLPARADPMTVGTVQVFVPVVLRVTKADPERRRRLAGTNVTACFMTDPTRGDVPVTGFCLRAMTLKALNMCVEPRRNCQSHATAVWLMTARATNASHRCVPRMIEFHVKAAESGKCFQSTSGRI